MDRNTTGNQEKSTDKKKLGDEPTEKGLGRYGIAGKFGKNLNLAVWQIVTTSPNINPRQIE